MRESKWAPNLIAGLAAVLVFVGALGALVTLRGCMLEEAGFTNEDAPAVGTKK